MDLTLGNPIYIERFTVPKFQNDNLTTFFTSENGNASYSFGAIIEIEDNVTRHLGAARFDANATGNLEFLRSIVGVYKALISDEKGTFAMWQLK